MEEKLMKPEYYYKVAEHITTPGGGRKSGKSPSEEFRHEDLKTARRKAVKCWRQRTKQIGEEDKRPFKFVHEYTHRRHCVVYFAVSGTEGLSTYPVAGAPAEDCAEGLEIEKAVLEQ